MSWSLALALVCRFYPGYTLEKLRDISLMQFKLLIKNMGEIAKIENGESTKKETPLTGSMGYKMAQRMLPPKSKIYGKK